MKSDASARPEFVQAHVRRLEALRRHNAVVRQEDRSWRILHDYLDRATSYERTMADKRPADITRHSNSRLSQMKTAMGATWLNEHLRDFDDESEARGFGSEVETARAVRRNFLMKQGFIEKEQRRLTQSTLDALQARDLKDAADTLAVELGKDYKPAPTKGRIEGIYVRDIERPSGRFALIERARDFSMVPWRDVLERNRGKVVSGLIRPDGVSWHLTKGRGIS